MNREDKDLRTCCVYEKLVYLFDSRSLLDRLTYAQERFLDPFILVPFQSFCIFLSLLHSAFIFCVLLPLPLTLYLFLSMLEKFWNTLAFANLFQPLLCRLQYLDEIRYVGSIDINLFPDRRDWHIRIKELTFYGYAWMVPNKIKCTI